jgi:hypothetical protein
MFSFDVNSSSSMLNAGTGKASLQDMELLLPQSPSLISIQHITI